MRLDVERLALLMQRPPKDIINVSPWYAATERSLMAYTHVNHRQSFPAQSYHQE